jgi:hypothetical protein
MSFSFLLTTSHTTSVTEDPKIERCAGTDIVSVERFIIHPVVRGTAEKQSWNWFSSQLFFRSKSHTDKLNQF